MRLWAALAGGAWMAFAAAASAATGPGTTAANFLNLDVGARPSALGGTFAGLADDVNAISYNPAGLAGLKRQEFTFMHNEHFEGVRQEWLAYAYPSQEHGTWAASLNALYVEPFASYDQFNRPTGKTSAADTAFHAAYAHALGESFSWGGGATLLRSFLADQAATGFAFDGGILYRSGGRFGAGFSVQNLGSRMRFINESYELPLTYRAGLSYAALQDSVGGHDLTLLTDMTTRLNRDPVFSGGLEYVRARILAVRAGAQSGRDAGIGYSLGLGLRLNRDQERLPEVAFDYTFADFGELSFTHKAGVTLRWGGKVAEPRWERSQVEAPPAVQWKFGPEEHFARAQSLIDRRAYDEAKIELEAAAALLAEEDRRRILYFERSGEVALRENKIDAAKEKYSEALKLAVSLGIRDAGVADAYAGLGACLLAQHDIPYATKFLKKALEIGPTPQTRRSVESQLQKLTPAKEGTKP